MMLENWEGNLPILLLVAEEGETPEARRQAFDALKNMAKIADQFGKKLSIDVYPKKVVLAPLFEFTEDLEENLKLLKWQYPSLPVRYRK